MPGCRSRARSTNWVPCIHDWLHYPTAVLVCLREIAHSVQHNSESAWGRCWSVIELSDAIIRYYISSLQKVIERQHRDASYRGRLGQNRPLDCRESSVEQIPRIPGVTVAGLSWNCTSNICCMCCKVWDPPRLNKKKQGNVGYQNLRNAKRVKTLHE